MNRTRLLFAALLLAATAAVMPVADAQVVHIVATGSSAEFQGFFVAAINDLPGAVTPAIPTNLIHHWSIKTSHTSTQGCGGTCAGLVDTRTSGIPIEYGNMWVVWADNGTGGAVSDIWAYVSVDSIVGVRTFLGQATVLLGTNIGTTTPDNIASPGLVTGGAGLNGAAGTCPTGFTESATSTCDDTVLPAAVITALQGASLTAALTDIRPEDALLGTLRILGTPTDTDDTSNPNPLCATAPTGTCRSWALGYGPGNVGTPIKSGTGTSTAAATPVNFALPGGTDPIKGFVVPNTITTFAIGESPIIFVTNRTNTTTGLGQLLPGGDGSYYARNVWDQHPYPPVSTPPAPTTRRPLGNMFTGHDCSTDNAAFTWPTDTGLPIPAGGTGQIALSKIHVILREPLSGTMNTTEFTEFRRYGTTNGSGAPGNGQPALVSQEQNIDPTRAASAHNNPLLALPCQGRNAGTAANGDRTRGIGTGEVMNGSGGGGVLGTADSISYTFFSFNNVSKLAASPSYGYLMIDGIDPLFMDYSNTIGNPGQIATPSTPLAWGELPTCSETPGSTLPHCTAAGIWGANASFPHLRDGSYPAWSVLRMMCDTANAHCTATSDPLGAESLVENLQFDIHSSKLGGVPDLLPFSDAASGALSFNPPYGDASFIREHYAFRASQYTTGTGILTAPTTTHESNTLVDFHLETCNGAGAAPGVPVNGPPSAECGGDAGGLVVPTSSTATGVLQ